MSRLLIGFLPLLIPLELQCGRPANDHAASPAERQTLHAARTPRTELPYQARFAPRTRGSGPVTVYELFDFQCPFCRSFALHTFPIVDSLYMRTGKIRWVIVYNPLPRHRNARFAAEVMTCAGRAGKFRESGAPGPA